MGTAVQLEGFRDHDSWPENAPSTKAFWGVCGALFAFCAAATIVSCASMREAGSIAMADRCRVSMAWRRMPGQTWPGAAASFLCMWVVMMVAMMLPSVAPMLWRYRHALAGTGEAGLGRRTAFVGVGYFVLWAAIGVVVYPVGVALTAVGMEQPAVDRLMPIGIGFVVVVAGLLQFTPWKARHLAGCRATPDPGVPLEPRKEGAFWQGLRLGLDCSRSCGNLMVIPLVLGVMDLSVMALVTAALTAERLSPRGDRVARTSGVFVVGAGLALSARAAGLL